MSVGGSALWADETILSLYAFRNMYLEESINNTWTWNQQENI